MSLPEYIIHSLLNKSYILFRYFPLSHIILPYLVSEQGTVYTNLIRLLHKQKVNENILEITVKKDVNMKKYATCKRT